jgi:predicted kinase
MFVVKESINDKNLFKAVFMAGGAGSGKSFISDLIFSNKTSPYGTKLINSDEFFEINLKKLNLPLVINVDDKEVYDQQMIARNKAKKTTNTKMNLHIDGMLPLIIDGTGKDFDKIKNQAEDLKSIGYDVYMIFVNTSLDVAKERNKKRERSVDEKIVEKMWFAVQNNIGKFQKYFGNGNFEVIDNSNYFEKNSKEEQDFKMYLFKLGKKIIESPLKNKIGIKTIETMKKSGYKYLSDF